MDSFEPVVADSTHSGHSGGRLQLVAGAVAAVVERPVGVEEGARRRLEEQILTTLQMPKMKEAVRRHWSRHQTHRRGWMELVVAVGPTPWLRYYGAGCGSCLVMRLTVWRVART